MRDDVDILMITHRRPGYVALALPRLLSSADERTRVFLWHNGDDTETLKIVERHSGHPAVADVVVSPDNAGIREPTNWMWRQSTAAFVSKVDDDCLVSEDWLDRLRRVHAASERTGVVGSWRFYPEDFDPYAAMSKVQRLDRGVRLLRNHWVQGSGYLARRAWTSRVGVIRDDETFNDWCIRVALAGGVNGWAFPFVHEEHMDDPRSPWTMYTDDEVFLRFRPLSAHQTGVDTIEAWEGQMRRSAESLQHASLDLREYRGWRRTRRNAWARVRRAARTVRPIVLPDARSQPRTAG